MFKVLHGRQPAAAAPDPVVVFTEGFESGTLNQFTTDAQVDWDVSNARPRTGTYSAHVDGATVESDISTGAIDLQGRTNATISWWWQLGSGFDLGETLKMWTSTDGGSNWVLRATVEGDVDPEGSYQYGEVTVNGISQLMIRFTCTTNGSTEDSEVDDISITAF